VADDIDLTATRELSQTLLGAQYRIEVGAAIAESDGIVCMVDLVKLLGDPPGKSSVNVELKVLERANLLARPNIKKDRRIDLVRQDSGSSTISRKSGAQHRSGRSSSSWSS